MVIEADRLTKIYGTTMAVNRLSVQVPQGQVVGFLGQNGAGKSTTIKMLLGLIRPSAGSGKLLGHDAQALPPAVWQRVGVVSEDPRLPQWMTIRQIIAFTSTFYERWDPAYAEVLRQQLELPEARRIKELSRGMREKIALLLALAFRPELLILDDPVSGLDPVVRHEFLEQVIQVVREEGHTVFFSSHIIDEVERVAQRIVILRKGMMLADQPLDRLKGFMRRVVAHFPGEAPAAELPGVVRCQRTDATLTYTVTNWEPAWLDRVKALGADSCEVQELDLQTILLDFIKGH